MMTPASVSRSPLPAVHAGFTLMEVLIAATVGMVLLFGTLSLFDTTYNAKARLMRTNEVFQSAVFALGTLQTDIRLAGFYGEGGANASVPGTAPDPCSNTPADWLSALALPIQAWEAESADLPDCVPDATLVADSSVIAIRRAATCEIGDTGCSTGANGTPMIQLSQCWKDATTAKTATNQTDLNLRGADCTSAAPRRQYLTRIYYLDENNVSGDGVATLKRLDMVGTTTLAPVTVAKGVEQMRLLYGVDNDGDDGIPDEWTATPSLANQRHIVDVKINLLARAEEADREYVNERTYTVGDVEVTAPGDGFFRTLVSAAVRVPNIAGRRESSSPVASAPAASPAAGG